MSRIQKVLLAIVYLICLVLILYIFFNFFDFRQLNDYSYIKDRTEILINFKNKNFYLFVFLGIIFSIIWILLLGFATPLAIIAGFIFGKYVGTVITIFSFTIGCTLLYMFANFYFKDIVLKHLSKKLEKFKHFFKKDEIVFYKNINDLAKKITKFSIDDKKRMQIAKNGRDKYFKYFNSTIIAEFIINKTFGFKKKYYWENIY